MSDMVEKVAKAIWDSRTRGADFRRYNYDWEHVAAEIRKNNMEHARAAIRAFMEPTRKMVNAGGKQHADGWVGISTYEARAGVTFRAMLKAALDD